MKLRIATLNVWGLPEPFSVQPLRRLRAIGERLPALELDAIAFQEVWFASARRVLLEAGARAGLVHTWSPGLRLGGSGLLVLSRHPIEQARLSTFALQGLPERVAQGEYYGGKGYVHLRLATPGGPVAFVDTHLHARYASEVPHAYIAHRSGQLVQLALASREIREPLLVAGDFNFVRDSTEHGVLEGLSGLRDLAWEAGGAEPTVLRSNPFRAGSQKPDRRIDFVFGRDGRGARVTPLAARRVFDEPIEGTRLFCSNHAGALLEVEVTDATGPTGFPSQPDTGAIYTAQALLARGRKQAKRRRRGQRTLTGAGLGLASLVAIGDRQWVRPTRRRVLRLGLQAAAAAALLPSLGCSVLSEVFVPDEIHAFDQLARALARLQASLARHPAGALRPPPA